MKPAAVIALLVGFLIPLPVSAQTPAGTVLEETVAPGRNYHQAQFKLWLPDVVGRSRDVAPVLFEDALALRLGDGAALKPMTEKSGLLGDLKARTFQALGEDKVPNYPTAWLPTARVAERWQWLVTEKP